MSHISAGGIVRVADLAHIALTPEETKRIAGELDVTAASVAKMSRVTTAGIPTTLRAIPLADVMCEDVVSPVPDHEEALSQAPASEEEMLLVSQILGEE